MELGIEGKVESKNDISVNKYVKYKVDVNID